VIVELEEQVLPGERDLDSREGAIIAWEEGLVTFACVLGEVSTERDGSHTRADAVRQDFSTQVSTFSSRSR
jgi:hypothetical protein